MQPLASVEPGRRRAPRRADPARRRGRSPSSARRPAPTNETTTPVPPVAARPGQLDARAARAASAPARPVSSSACFPTKRASPAELDDPRGHVRRLAAGDDARLDGRVGSGRKRLRRTHDHVEKQIAERADHWSSLESQHGRQAEDGTAPVVPDRRASSAPRPSSPPSAASAPARARPRPGSRPSRTRPASGNPRARTPNLEIDRDVARRHRERCRELPQLSLERCRSTSTAARTGTCSSSSSAWTRRRPKVCETCGEGPLERVLYPVAVHFKGSGFYSTDYGRGSGARKREESKDGEGPGDTETKKKDEKKDQKDRRTEGEGRRGLAPGERVPEQAARRVGVAASAPAAAPPSARAPSGSPSRCPRSA